MRLELDQLELSTIIASLGKSRHYFECGIGDERTADSLQQIRLKLIKQGEKEGVFKDYLTPVIGVYAGEPTAQYRVTDTEIVWYVNLIKDAILHGVKMRTNKNNGRS